jgi:hypothetical protein
MIDWKNGNKQVTKRTYGVAQFYLPIKLNIMTKQLLK